MRLLNFSIPRDERPAYQRIADGVREAVLAGKLHPGEALPSTREIAAVAGAHRHTVMTALDELVAAGWVVAKERQGYRVCETLPVEELGARATPRARAGRRHEPRLVRSAGVERLVADGPVRFNFQSGLPDLRLFPHAELRSCLARALRRSGPELLGFGDPAGHPPFVAALATYLRRARQISDREIVVTHGSQEGLFLAAQLLVAPGDAVAVEALGYSPAWGALRAAGGRLVPVGVDEQGLDPDALARVLSRRRIRLLYLTPLHQYPTTVTLPAARRLRVYELAVQYGVPILEDDYDHEFHYRCQPLAPLASADPAGLVVHVSTFSKVLYPSARLGFMALPASLASPARDFRRIVSRQNDAVLQEGVRRWMQDGGLERHLRRMRRVYEERRDALVGALEEARARGHRLAWRVPDGGMALWLDTFQDSAALARRARARGIHVVPEARFQLTPTRGTHLRLGFASQSPEEIRAGVRSLLSLVPRQ